MISMKDVGQNIATLRKQNGLTQMELAEKLSISYQAISSWERGETFPDITKLPELSEIFSESIDVLLGNNITDRNLKTDNNITASLNQEVKEKQQDRSNLRKDLNDIIGLLPFSTQEKANDLALSIVENRYSLNEVLPILPFVGMEISDKIVVASIDNKTSYEELLTVFPFMSKPTINQIVLNILNTQTTLNEITLLFPFVSREVIDQILLDKINESSLEQLSALFPFASKEINNKVFKKALADGVEMEELLRIFPFVSSEVIKDNFDKK